MAPTGHARIVMDPGILSGKPTIKGTRISVELILECLAGGWSREEILSNFPTIVDADISAALSYAQKVVSKKRAVQDAA